MVLGSFVLELLQHRHIVTSCWRQWRRCTRPERAVLLVDRGSNSTEWLALILHGHHVPRDVEADVSGGAMVGEGDASTWQPLGDIAVGIVAVANLPAAAKTGDVLKEIPMPNGVAVRLLDFRARLLGEGG